MSERLSKAWTTAWRVANAGAWIFALGTLGALLFVAWFRGPGSTGESHIMSVTVDGQDHVGLGLNYVGVAGTVLLLAEAAVVVSAMVMSVLPRRRLRRIGHGVLVLWSGLWLGNAVYLARLDWGFVWALFVTLFAFLFLCTLLRAIRGWNLARPLPSRRSESHRVV